MEKECVDCKEVLELSLSNFYAVRQRSDGFDSKCRKCRNAYHRKHKENTIGVARKAIKQSKIDSTETVCVTCKVAKPKTYEFFYKNDKTIDGLSNVCIDCRNAYLKEHRKDPTVRGKARGKIQQKKVELIKYLGSACAHCNTQYNETNAAIFDFHHINESMKSFTISNTFYKSLQDLKAEADKCILLCSNCHRLVHSMPY